MLRANSSWGRLINHNFEKILFEHEDILSVAVVAQPDERWGESPCAFVELCADSKVDADALAAFCKTRLAGFKKPKRFVFGALPKTSTGKIRKNELRMQAQQLAGKS